MKKLPISIIIHTLNEEVNLPFALKSANFLSDEIFIVDSESTDKTKTIAEQHGALVYTRKCNRGTLVDQRNWALDNLPFKNEWVFILDADEVVDDFLIKEMYDLFNIESNMSVAYYLRFKNIFLGQWLRHSSMYPTWSLRLFKHKNIRYERREANSHPIVHSGKISYLKGHILNYDRRPFKIYLSKINEFSDLESKAYLNVIKNKNQVSLLKGKLFGTTIQRRRYLKNLFIKLPFRPLIIFLYLYIFRLGFLDGNAGFHWAVYKMFLEWSISRKIEEIKGPEMSV